MECEKVAKLVTDKCVLTHHVIRTVIVGRQAAQCVRPHAHTHVLVVGLLRRQRLVMMLVILRRMLERVRTTNGWRTAKRKEEMTEIY